MYVAIDPLLEMHPRFAALRRAGGFSSEQAIAVVFRVWSLARLQRQDGRLRGFTKETLDDVLGMAGSTAALVTSGFVIVREDSLELKSWMEWNGTFLKDRARKSKSRKKKRLSEVRVTSSEISVDPDPDPDPDPKEESKEERKVSARTLGRARAVFPLLDLELIEAKLMSYNDNHRFKDLDRAFLNWCKSASTKGIDLKTSPGEKDKDPWAEAYAKEKARGAS